MNNTGYAARLYNGTEYIRTYPNTTGHPFVEKDSLLPGAVAYDGTWYTGIHLNYDIVRDEVIIKGPHLFFIKLVPEKVDSFNINGRHFRRLATKAGSGFYEVLHNGKVQVLAKRTKRIGPVEREEDLARFVESQTFFILRNGVLSQVSNKAGLLSAFDAGQEAVKKHLQQANLNFRRKPEQALISAAAFYDQIQN